MQSLLIALALLATVQPAVAQSAPAPKFVVGDTWTFKSGSETREATVLKVEPGAIEVSGLFFQCPACRVVIDDNINPQTLLDASGKPIDVVQFGFVPIGGSWKFWDVPLEVKKRWEFATTGFSRGRTANYVVTNVVEKIEDVKTPAGVFKTYKIQRDWIIKAEAQTRVSDGRWTTTTWYAPDARMYVKSASTAANAREWELTSLSLK